MYEENSTGNAPYRILLSASYDDTSKDDTTKKCNKFRFNPSTCELNVNNNTGTTTADSLSTVVIGNNTPAGTAGSSTGRLFLYSDGTKAVDLRAASNSSANRIIYLPNKAGTVALTNDLTALNTVTQTKASVTPTSSGKSTLLSYILDAIQPLGYSTYTFAASGFSDLPSTDWGYTLTVYFEGGAVMVQALKHQSNFNIFYRAVSASSQWIGNWVAK